MITLTVNNRKTNVFLKIYDILRFKFCIFIANITIHFHYFNLSKFYSNYFDIILPFSIYLEGENKFVYSNKLLPFNIKSTNPIQKYPHIIES